MKTTSVALGSYFENFYCHNHRDGPFMIVLFFSISGIILTFGITKMKIK